MTIERPLIMDEQMTSITIGNLIQLFRVVVCGDTSSIMSDGQELTDWMSVRTGRS